MISFLDLFKWDRFVATSFIELLFWLLTAVAVLLGIVGVFDGIAEIALDPAGGLVAIAVSIIGGLAGIVGARALCEAVIMLFRVNESLLDIRDSLAAANPAAVAVAPQQSQPASPPSAEPPALSFAEVLEQALAEPDPAAMMPPVPVDLDLPEPRQVEPVPETARPAAPRAAEPKSTEPRSIEPKSAETSSLEARLAEIRARREGATAAAGRAATPAPPAPRAEKAPSVGSVRGGVSEPATSPISGEAGSAAGPSVVSKPAVSAAKPKPVEAAAPNDAATEALIEDISKALARDAAANADKS